MAAADKEKKSRKAGKTEKKSKADKKAKHEPQNEAAGSALSLLADEKNVDSALSSLFAVKQPPVKSKPVATSLPVESANLTSEDGEDDEDNEAELSELDEEIDDEDDEMTNITEAQTAVPAVTDVGEPRRKRKRKDVEEQIEDAYMSRLAREEEKDAERLAADRAAKRTKKSAEEPEAPSEGGSDGGEESGTEDSNEQYETASEGDGETEFTPPKHETEEAKDVELEKANRTVFLGNVSTAAITSKSSRKVLMNHMASFFPTLPSEKAGSKPKVKSIRFRSTPYAAAMPKKAAYAKKELMDATTKSTNAYVVYSTPILAREACQHLNGTIVLDRHLRVDSIAHPAKIDNRRCVFVGNLGFVDDETNIQEANEQDGRDKRKRGKEPADIEEGLWRTFGKCGKVESVRVIRDSTTRVGKGIAYVQFEDENAVEAALLLNEKKFPPMLPRKLRVSRAKAPKKNAKAGSGRPSLKPQQQRPGTGSGYHRKLTAEEASRLGRSAKLLGRAAAANLRKGGADKSASSSGSNRFPGTAVGGIKGPESFVFEGHRASARSGKSGLKLGGSKGAKGKSKSKVTKRSASFKQKKTKA